MTGNLFAPEIEELIVAHDFATIKEVFEDWEAPALAELVADLSAEGRAVVLGILPRDLASEAFAYCEPSLQRELVRAMTTEHVAAMLNEMPADDRTEFFQGLPANMVTELVNQLSVEERVVALRLLNYPEDSVGRLMTPDYVQIKKHWTVQEALDHVRQFGKDSETLNVLYVTDHGTLVDEIGIREVLLAQPNAFISDLMDYRAESLRATDSEIKALEDFRRLDRYALPVVDDDHKLVGIVTLDDVLDVAEERATEEIQRFGGLDALEDSYTQTGFWELVRKRGVWLIVLFIGEMLTTTAMGRFEHEIAKAVVLALFVPLIISSGGNSGSQAATLIIRALALKEVSLRDWWLVMRREIASGFILGIILATIGFLRISIWQWAFGTYGAHWAWIGVTVSISLTGVVLWGTLTGSMLPLILKRLGLDPATSSAPFVATLVDVTGILIYFSVASMLLQGLVL